MELNLGGIANRFETILYMHTSWKNIKQGLTILHILVVSNILG